MMRWLSIALVLALAPVAQAACGGDVPQEKCSGSGELSGELKRFYALENLIKAAYDAGDLAGATGLAGEYLELAKSHRSDWNYGNAIHDANRYFGLISLQKGDQPAAVSYLLKAGKSPGSPQLDTFGPQVDLADALLKAGEVDAVKAYLKDIGRFWEMNNGKVDDWLKDIERGGRPALNRFPPRHGSRQIALLWLAALWPALVAGVSAALLWGRIAKRWWFALAALLAGYASMITAGLAFSFVMSAILRVMVSDAPWAVLPLIYATMAVSFVVPVLVVLVISRFFARQATS